MNLPKLSLQKGAMLVALLLVLVLGTTFFAALFGQGYGRGSSGKTMMSGNGRMTLTAPAAPSVGVFSQESGRGMVQRGLAVATDATSIPENSADRKITTNASLDLRVQNLDWTIGKISEITLAKGGYVASVNRNVPQSGTHTAWMVVKLPSQDFFGTFEELKKNVYYITNESLSGEDVTQSYNDLQARLKNKQEEEGSLQSLMAKAVKIDDVIAITDRLTQVRTEIESLQAQVRMMNNQTEMATVAVSMVEDPKIAADTQPFTSGSVFRQAVKDLLQALLRMGAGLVMVAVIAVPILIVYVALFAVVFFFTKKGVRRFFDR